MPRNIGRIKRTGEDELSREIGNQYERLAQQYFESIGLIFMASNVVVNGGEVDLLMQSEVDIEGELRMGELCIIEVKGRKVKSDWTDEVVSLRKAKRWRLAAQHVLWRLEDGEWSIPLAMTGIQFVLVRIEGQMIEVNWNATDLDLG